MFYNDKQKSYATYLPTQKQDAFLKRVVSFQKEKMLLIHTIIVTIKLNTFYQKIR